MKRSYDSIDKFLKEYEQVANNELKERVLAQLDNNYQKIRADVAIKLQGAISVLVTQQMSPLGPEIKISIVLHEATK